MPPTVWKRLRPATSDSSSYHELNKSPTSSEPVFIGAQLQRLTNIIQNILYKSLFVVYIKTLWWNSTRLCSVLKQAFSGYLRNCNIWCFWVSYNTRALAPWFFELCSLLCSWNQYNFNRLWSRGKRLQSRYGKMVEELRQFEERVSFSVADDNSGIKGL